MCFRERKMGLSMPGNVWYTIPVIQRNRPTGRREGGFMLQETLAYEVLSVVEEIPAGKVATYGQIARLIGRPQERPPGGADSPGGRAVWELSLSPGGKPRRPPGPRLAGAGGLLAAEGVFLNQRGCVDLARDQWDC